MSAMHFMFVAVALAGASLAAEMSPLDPLTDCAKACIREYASNMSCDPTSMKCVCDNFSALASTFSSCLAANCSAEELAKTQQQAVELCPALASGIYAASTSRLILATQSATQSLTTFTTSPSVTASTTLSESSSTESSTTETSGSEPSETEPAKKDKGSGWNSLSTGAKLAIIIPISCLAAAVFLFGFVHWLARVRDRTVDY